MIFTRILNTVILLSAVIMAWSTSYGKSIGSGAWWGNCEWPDSTDSAMPEGPTGPQHVVNVHLMLGRQIIGKGWSPYEMQTVVAASVQLWRGTFPLPLDEELVVAWSGETDADGRRAGPGTSFVELHSGLVKWWDVQHTLISFYAGGGFNYTWAKFELPDMSKAPLPISEFLGYPVYPDMDQSGHFWGGYLRAGVVFHPAEKWQVGINALASLTTSRIILGRSLNANSFAIGLFAGGGD